MPNRQGSTCSPIFPTLAHARGGLFALVLAFFFPCSSHCPPNKSQVFLWLLQRAGLQCSGLPIVGWDMSSLLPKSHFHTGTENLEEPPKLWEIRPTSPNPKDGLGDTRCSGQGHFNYSLARSGVWWAATSVTVGFWLSWYSSPSSSSSLAEY